MTKNSGKPLCLALQVLAHLVELMTDPFGNYLIQKLLDRCSEQQRSEVLNEVRGVGRATPGRQGCTVGGQCSNEVGGAWRRQGPDTCVTTVGRS